MLRLGVPTVAVVIGEGGSGGAIAIAVADRVLMQENAIYSVISPEGCASILWRDASQAKKAASAFKPDAAHCLELGVIDGIVPEPEGGAQVDHDAAAALLRDAVDRPSARARGRLARRAPAHAPGEVPLDGRPRARLSAHTALHTFHRLIPRIRKAPAFAGKTGQAVTSAVTGAGHSRGDVRSRRWPGSATIGGSATRAARRSRSAGRPEGRAALRHPAPRRTPAPLRPAARAGRGARELGRAEGAAARARRAAPRRPRRGPSARLRDLRGRDPAGPVRRRHGRDLGPGHLRAARGEARRRPHVPARRRARRGRLDARAGPARRRGAATGSCSARTASRALAREFAAQLATSVEPLPTGPEWLFEPKWDGYRAHRHRSRAARRRSRAGTAPT